MLVVVAPAVCELDFEIGMAGRDPPTDTTATLSLLTTALAVAASWNIVAGAVPPQRNAVDGDGHH